MTRRPALLAAAFALCAGAAQAVPYQHQPAVTVEHYVFNLDLPEQGREIKGETVITVRFDKAGQASVWFDLTSKTASGDGMTVASVVEDGSNAPLRFTHEKNKLAIQLGRPAKAGEERVFRIKYSGQPLDGLRFGKSRYGERVAFSWNWPIHMRDWAPAVDHPSSKVTSEFVVTAPGAYTVVANGLLQGEVALPDGRKTTHWKQGVPIAPWLNAIGVGRMQTWTAPPARGVPLQIWAPVGAKVDTANGFLIARRTIDFFGDMMGPYPYEKLGQVIAPFDGSSTEHASVIFYGDAGTWDGHPELRSRGGDTPALSRGNTPVHEIAHQWFGDSLTETSWGDVWLSEGFATYFTDLYVEHFEGRDALVASLRNERTRAIAAERKEKIPVVAGGDEDGPHLTQVQYAKGGWVLHMLRQQVGDEAFFKAIKAYYRAHATGSATTADLRMAMEEASGQDLKGFFAQWLTRVDSPKLDVMWAYDDAAKALKVTVVQQQPGEAYRLPIEVGVAETAGGPLQVLKLDMTKKTQEFSLPMQKPVAEVVFDPETRLLADVSFSRR
jgi:aminopeptidase N